MTKHRIIPAIMSGGSGTRLWPASTEARPKQFHALLGGRTLIAETLLRLSGETDAVSFAPPLVLANAAHRELVRAELAGIGASPAAIALEPSARNTAATAVIAAALGAELDPDALVLLSPADHVIADRAAFLAAVAAAAPFARERIVTFGIRPDRPETGYGYIEQGAALGAEIYVVAKFHEKPDEATAADYLRRGGFLWNSGMFLFSPRVLLQEFDAAADIRDGARAAFHAATRNGPEILLDAALFAQVRKESLDIAVMQTTQHAAVAPCAIGWADVGSWDEIWRLSPHDAQGNALHGKTVAQGSSNNLLRSEGPTICVSGIEGLVVIATDDAVLILPRDRAQDAKTLRELAEKLK